MGADRRFYTGAGNQSRAGEEKVILFNWSGHGLVDMSSYDAYLSGKLQAYELPDEEIQRALLAIKDFPKP